MKKRRYALVLLDVLLMYKKMNGEEAMAVFPAGGMVTILNGSESLSCSQRGVYYVEGLALRVKFLIPASHVVLLNLKRKIVPKERAIHALCFL